MISQISIDQKDFLWYYDLKSYETGEADLGDFKQFAHKKAVKGMKTFINIRCSWLRFQIQDLKQQENGYNYLLLDAYEYALMRFTEQVNKLELESNGVTANSL